ncbi:HlyD family efflux transporter periplasmic adaptor subunit [Aliamphritea spongicola]|nr:HlyD family efflux transporter periplasmic adaptor subunit [Aliamphritea spongicola]
MAAAEARLNAARLTLQNATTLAPFSGFITERMVSPGQTVNTGDAMIRLVDDSQLELTVELSRNEWALLQQPVAGRQAQLFAEDNRPLGHADIRQGGGFLDQKSRQYRIFLEISNATESPVLSGDFVRVALPGITIPDALNIPASALTQAGKLWYLDRNSQLQHLMPDVISRMQSRLIIRNPDSQISSWRIATTPLAAFLPGMRVSGREE